MNYYQYELFWIYDQVDHINIIQSLTSLNFGEHYNHKQQYYWESLNALLWIDHYHTAFHKVVDQFRMETLYKYQTFKHVGYLTIVAEQWSKTNAIYLTALVVKLVDPNWYDYQWLNLMIWISMNEYRVPSMPLTEAKMMTILSYSKILWIAKNILGVNWKLEISTVTEINRHMVILCWGNSILTSISKLQCESLENALEVQELWKAQIAYVNNESKRDDRKTCIGNAKEEISYELDRKYIRNISPAMFYKESWPMGAKYRKAIVTEIEQLIKSTAFIFLNGKLDNEIFTCGETMKIYSTDYRLRNDMYSVGYCGMESHRF